MLLGAKLALVLEISNVHGMEVKEGFCGRERDTCSITEARMSTLPILQMNIEAGRYTKHKT